MLASFDVAPVKWAVVSTDSELEGSEGSKAIDSNPTTAWRTDPEEGSYPHEIVIDLGEELNLKGFTYTLRQEGNISGTIYRYNFYISEDGENWQKVIDEGTFGNIKNNPIQQEVNFDKIYDAPHIKLQGLSSVNGDESLASVGEILIQ